MSADTEMITTPPRRQSVAGDVNAPSTPPEPRQSASASVSSSQQSLPSTEGPASPIDRSVSSLKTELNDDHLPSSQPRVIPSSLTPPPSSQVPQQFNGTSGMPLGYISSQRATMFSPPATTLNNLRRDGNATTAAATTPSEYIPPTSDQIQDASIEELRTMFQACLADNARLKMETAHHKLQYNLLSMQADEDAKRAAVEHDMTRREVEVLRMAEDSRIARRELNAAAQSTQAKYLQMKASYEAAMEDNNALHRRLKLSKKVIQQKEDEITDLIDERDMLLNRIRENREHFHILCSPGGVFHGALTPKTPAATSPQQHRATPRHTPKAAYQRDARHDSDPNQAPFAALLQALSHDNNSAPSTPITSTRPAPRMPPKHTRGAQSLSSLPTTPYSRSRGDHAGLLPSVDLVPQTEPRQRYGGGRAGPETPTPVRGRKSRESTISADDNEELARAALESVAAATQSYMSQGSRGSRRHDEEEEEVSESQASQAASEMLRRDPRESFEVASSVGSRDGTPAPAEKSARLQSKLFAGVNKAALASEKRKFSGGAEHDNVRRDKPTSPAKKMRYGNGDDSRRRVGLGIQYSQEG